MKKSSLVVGHSRSKIISEPTTKAWGKLIASGRNDEGGSPFSTTKEGRPAAIQP
jgi:hypothetical protein